MGTETDHAEWVWIKICLSVETEFYIVNNKWPNGFIKDTEYNWSFIGTHLVNILFAFNSISLLIATLIYANQGQFRQ